MQKEELLIKKEVSKIIEAVYEVGNPVVREDYSKYDKDIISFDNAVDLISYINRETSAGEIFLGFAIYYPDTKGFVREEKITLDPDYCNGHNFKFKVVGWGIIYLHLNYKDIPNISCHFTANTEKRANSWFSVSPGLKSPSLWDWVFVQKHISRLVRKLKKYSLSAVS